MKYLGLPLTVIRLKRIYFQPLEDKRERYDEIATVLGFEFNVHKSGVVPVGKRK